MRAALANSQQLALMLVVWSSLWWNSVWVITRKMTWADSQRNGVCGRARESEHSLDAQLCVSEDVDCVSQWFDRWFRFLRAERSTPQSRALPAYDFLRTIAAVGCYAGDDGDYDFAWWQPVVLPTLSAHVLGA